MINQSKRLTAKLFFDFFELRPERKESILIATRQWLSVPEHKKLESMLNHRESSIVQNEVATLDNNPDLEEVMPVAEPEDTPEVIEVAGAANEYVESITDDSSE